MAMRAKRGANFAQNAVPFFAFMVGGSYGISVLLQVGFCGDAGQE
tara:strand:- start:15413 stop:15547 length:135 start_codon:yes stop_codon:yes gene_type:complete